MFHPYDHFCGFLCTHSNRSMSFLCWGLQHWTQDFRWGLTRAEQKDRIPCLALLAMRLLMKPKTWSTIWATSTHCWLMLSFLPINTPKSSSLRLLSVSSSHTLYLCLGLPWPMCRTLYLALLKFMMFAQAHISRLSRSLWMASLPSSMLTTWHSLVSSENFLVFKRSAPIWASSTWTLLPISYIFSTSEQHRGVGNRDWVISSHVVSAAPSSSGEELLTLFPCFSVGSLPQERVVHELVQHESFPQAAVIHEFVQRWSFPRGAVLQEQAAPALVLHGVTSPARKCAPAWGPLSMGPQVLPGLCSSMGLPWGHSLLLASPCSSVESASGCRWRSATPWTSMGCRVTAYLIMVFSMGCSGISAPVLGACPPPSSSLTLVSAESFLSRSLTSPSSLFCCHTGFFPHLRYVIPEAVPLSLTGLALAHFGISFIGHRGGC